MKTKGIPKDVKEKEKRLSRLLTERRFEGMTATIKPDSKENIFIFTDMTMAMLVPFAGSHTRVTSMTGSSRYSSGAQRHMTLTSGCFLAVVFWMALLKEQ